MGLCSSRNNTSSEGEGNTIVPSAAERKRNNKIDQQQKADAARRREQIKILFLGPGDSGKSTMLKQMRILYGDGYPETERKALVKGILFQLKADTTKLLNTCTKHIGPLTDEASIKAAELVQASNTNKFAMEPEVAKSIITLWKDPMFQQAWGLRNEHGVLESYEDLSKKLKDYPKWGGDKWVPDIEDSLLSSVRTTGIVEHKLSLDGVGVTVIDVGGQRNERQKWIHSFDSVTAVIYMAAISEYDQLLFEDKNENRLVEALDLFKEIVSSAWFKRSRIILFLNKTDLFREKYCIRHIPLNISGHFPTAPEDPSFRFNDGTAWFLELFQGIANAKGRRDMYAHFTCALDNKYMDVVFTACKDAILQHSLVASGLIDNDEVINIPFKHRHQYAPLKVKNSWIPPKN